MRITYVTSGLPYPLTSGKLRHYFLMRGLAERHEVTLLALTSGSPDHDHVREVERFARVRLEPEASSRTPIRRALGLKDEATRRVVAYLQRSHAQTEAEVLVVSGRRSWALFRSLRGRVPMIFDLCDARSLHLSRSFRFAVLRQRPAIALRFALARWRERATVAGADAVMFGSPRDYRAIVGENPPEGRSAIVPNGVDVEYWRRTTDRLGAEIVFTGAMDYPPNTDAALYLAEAVMPLVRRELRDARLRIVGRDPPASLRRLAAQPGVTVTGFVEDMRPELEAAAVFAAPLRFGAGIQNKLLEAMAMQVPCVASPLAAAGLETVDGASPPIDSASQTAEFAACLVRRMKEVAVDPRPPLSSRAYVERHFSWPAAVARLEEVLLAVVPRAQRPP